MKYNWIAGVSLALLLVFVLSYAKESDKAFQKRVAELPQRKHTGEIAASDHTTLRFHEFTPPKYPGKKCLFVETGAYRSGLTCWDMPR